MTNYEHIKGMGLFEMAKYLANELHCCPWDDVSDYICPKPCYSCFSEWLEKDYKERSHEQN